LATNKKITALSELSEINLADDDVLAVVDVSAGTTHKVRKSTLASALAGVASISADSPLAVSASTGSVTVSTGTIPVSKGGTGATSLTDGGVLLGSGTGAVTAMGVLSDGQMIVGDGTTDPVAESGATLRSSIGVGTGDSPQFTAVNIGAASDTTVARASAGDINVEGNLVYRAGGTDVPVADGGTGASSLTDGGVLLGSGTGAITAMAVLGDGEMIVGDGTTDPVAESGATLRTSIGLGTMAVVNTNAVPAQTLAGAVTGADQIVSAINLKDYGEVTNAIGATGGGTQDINLTLGNSVTATVDTSANTFTFSNPTSSDELCGFTLELTNGGSQTVNWPGTVDWAGGSAPTLTTSGVDYLVFWTVNGGSRWYGALVGLAFA
jgi:hypothetical protein